MPHCPTTTTHRNPRKSTPYGPPKPPLTASAQFEWKWTAFLLNALSLEATLNQEKHLRIIGNSNLGFVIE